MSKRHQNNRRKSYGRRQHELAERRQRDDQPDATAMGPDEFASGSMGDGLAFLDSRMPRLRYAMGE